jgi:hypothetical protein
MKKLTTGQKAARMHKARAAARKAADTKTRSAAKTFRWHDYCHSLKAIGLMANFSKGECLRVRTLLVDAITLGRVEQIGRGEYRLT